jgi:hypothetical protein
MKGLPHPALLGAAVLLFAAPAVCAGAEPLPWEVWTSPAILARVSPDDQVLERSSHCLDGCRYDRSNAGPEAPADNPYPGRWLYARGEERVLFDEPGAGAVTRIWMTTGFGTSSCIDPGIIARLYVDGASAPTLELPLAALFDGSAEPFTPPLVADAAAGSGGYVSHVPIAHARGLRFTLANIDNGPSNPCTGNDQRLLWFQFTFHRLPPATPVVPFSPSETFAPLRAFLAHAGDDPWSGMLQPIEQERTLHPGETLDLATFNGPGWLRGIRLLLPRSAYPHVRLQLAFDGVQTADVPLDAFFAQPAAALQSARSVLLGEDASGWLYSWFPMPFETGASARLASDAALPGAVPVISALSFDAAAVPEGAPHFAAATTDACVDAGDVTLHESRGAGRVVAIGASYLSAAGDSRGYLEGDERVTIDGALSPSWYGTGVEDFYNGGFYFDRGPYSLPFSGATEVDATGDQVTSAYRLLLADSPSYGSAIRFTQEAGFSPTQPVPTCARATFFTYATDRPSRITYDRLEVGDPLQAAAHRYMPPPEAVCEPLDDNYASEPPLPRRATVCRYTRGVSRFRMHVGEPAASMRLRRTFDAGLGMPGSSVGSPPATIFVNGIEAGWLPPAVANPLRRWQEQEVPLSLAAPSPDLDIEVVPDFDAFPQGTFTESAWEVGGSWRDTIHADGFDPHGDARHEPSS